LRIVLNHGRCAVAAGGAQSTRTPTSKIEADPDGRVEP
jgi:hypothetical protein